MNKFIQIISIALMVFFTSCNNKKEAPKLNEDQFIKLLIDIHIADGTLSAQNIYRSGNNQRPSYYYNSIYKKYNLSPVEFDSCVSYYASNAKKFTEIYDIVIDSLNKLDTKYRIDIKNAKLEQDTVNLWKKKKHWIIPKNGKPNFDFSIPVNQRGIYTVSAQIKISEKDQSENTTMTAYFWKEDTLNGPQKVHFDTLEIKKDSIFKTYSIQLEYPDTTYTELRGNIFAWNNDLPQFTQDYEIKNIMIYNPEIKLDSIQLEKEIQRHLNHDALRLEMK
nr:DUF4296 domain-containing protein [uncultured Marinifilum sp.]